MSNIKDYNQLRQEPNYFPEYTDEDDGDYGNDSWAHVDWKERADTILPAIDALLAEYGLEVVTGNCGDDSYHFTIAQRIPKTATIKLIWPYQDCKIFALGNTVYYRPDPNTPLIPTLQFWHPSQHNWLPSSRPNILKDVNKVTHLKKSHV